MSVTPVADVIVVGAGVVGAAAAYGLARRGVKVLAIDGGDGDYRATLGNGGLVWAQGASPGMPALVNLRYRSLDLWSAFADELTDLTGVDLEYECSGTVNTCFGDEQFEKRRDLLTRLDKERNAGVPDVVMVDRAGLEDLFPRVRLGPDVSGGSYCARDGHVNPMRLLRALQEGIKRCGGALVSGQPVHRIRQENGAFAVDTPGATYRAARLLIAAGNGSGPLARQVGLDIPVRPQRGQKMITERVAPILPIPLGPLRQTRDGTIQLGGTVEEVGFDVSTTTAAAATMTAQCIRILPCLADVKVVRQWSALRIMTPDGYPIYAASQTHPGAFVAVCHGGILLAAAHVGLLGDALASGRLPDAVSPFHHRRFDVQEAV